MTNLKDQIQQLLLDFDLSEIIDAIGTEDVIECALNRDEISALNEYRDGTLMTFNDWQYYSQGQAS